MRRGRIEWITAPVRRFLHVEAASGVVLVVCAILAIVLANSRWHDAVHHFWETPIRIGIGAWELNYPLHFWINDGLMVIFFFVVGMEIKREIVTGELSSPRKAALPVIAALGGMIVPAAIFLSFGHDSAASRGWGIPMATDIAFVVGILALFGPRVPLGLKIFLLSLAIVDDLGAVVVIAAAYSENLNLTMLGFAGAGLLLTIALNWLGVRPVPVYFVVGVGVWLAIVKSGIHPTISGVLLGLLTPTTAWFDRNTLSLALDDVVEHLSDSEKMDELRPGDLVTLRTVSREAVSPLHRLIDHLHPWVSFVFMPLFALANAGVEIELHAAGSQVALAVAAGLVFGKTLGILGFSWLAVKIGVGRLPQGVSWPMMFGASILGGIGFTMALFIAGLAYPNSPESLVASKIGILMGSLAATVVGGIVLIFVLRKKFVLDQ